MNEHEMVLMYLLKILGPGGRQTLKDAMMEAACNEDPMAGKLMKAINKLEMGLGQLDRMTDDERRKVGLPPKGTR